MTRFVLHRVGTSMVMLVLISMVVFVVLRVIPGDPTLTRLGETKGVDPRTIEAIRHELGLDRSIPSQYAHWIVNVLKGDFGSSYFSQFSVTELIRSRIGPTLLLTVMSMVLAVLIAAPLAIWSSVRRGRTSNAIASTYISLGMATPPFIVGIAFIGIFSVKFDVLPNSDYVSPFVDPLESMKVVFFPSLTLAIVVAAPIAKVFRASLRETSSAPYVRTAVGKGLVWRQAVIHHVVPNSLVPTLTYIGLTFAYLLGGAVIVEFVFGYEGLGTLMIDAVFKRDYAVLQAIVLLVAAIFILTTLVVDVICGVIDPRLRIDRRSRSTAPAA